MEISLILLKQIIELFFIMLMGMAIVKCGLLKSSDSKILSVVMVYLVMPCVIIHSFQIHATSRVQKGLIYAVVLSVIVHIIFLLCNQIFTKIFHMNAIEQTSIIYSNAGILVIPLVKALLGSEYVVYSCAFLVIQLVLIWTHGTSLISGKRQFALKQIIKNNNLIAIIVGAVLFLLHISLLDVIDSTLNTTGSMIGPIGMMLAGMVIADSSLKKLFCTARNYLSVLLRLVILPVITLIVLRVIGASGWVSNGKSLLMIVYLAAITPTCATLTSLAQLYDKHVAQAGEVYVLSTILSIITMPVFIGIFQWIFA